jgi:hypothetical protein
MNVAPRATARFTAIPRSLTCSLLASTRRIEQLGQIAETISRSSAISAAQPESVAG